MVESTNNPQNPDNPEDIKLGDIVFLKSGFTAMTVIKIEENMATCIWEDKGQKKDIYPLISLTKINPNRPIIIVG